MRTIETKIYTFDELSDRAKENAREWYRSCQDSSDLEHVVDGIAQTADMLGINLRTRPVKLMGGGTRYEPKIFYSVSFSQGDGASFEGTYSYKPGALKAIRADRPTDTELQGIARDLQQVQRRNFYRLTADITSRRDTSVEVNVDGASCNDDENIIEQAMRDFASWAYHRLRDEVEYQNSDEVVDENIIANEYEFDENGWRV